MWVWVWVWVCRIPLHYWIDIILFIQQRKIIYTSNKIYAQTQRPATIRTENPVSDRRYKLSISISLSLFLSFFLSLSLSLSVSITLSFPLSFPLSFLLSFLLYTRLRPRSSTPWGNHSTQPRHFIKELLWISEQACSISNAFPVPNSLMA